MVVLTEVTVSLYLFSEIGIYNRFFTEFVCLNSLLQVLWILSFFYERYTRDEIRALEKEPMFWFCLGLLIYAPTTYFLFVYYEFVKNNHTHLWTIHSLLNTCMYVLFSVGICTNIKQTSKF